MLYGLNSSIKSTRPKTVASVVLKVLSLLRFVICVNVPFELNMYLSSYIPTPSFSFGAEPKNSS